MGSFINNTAHSCGQHGSWFGNEYLPRKYPCRGISATNPVVISELINYTAWANKEEGFRVKLTVGINFINVKMADNFIAGIEVSKTPFGQGLNNITGGIFVGKSNNPSTRASEKAIWLPRTEYFEVHGSHFYNFQTGAVFGTCSECILGCIADSGARTSIHSNLYFDSTVNRRIIYDTRYNHIFSDLDGTLTGKGPNSWATFTYKHNLRPECEDNQAVYNGMVCNGDV